MMLIVQIFLSLQEHFTGSFKHKFQMLEKYQYGAILWKQSFLYLISKLFQSNDFKHFLGL